MNARSKKNTATPHTALSANTARTRQQLRIGWIFIVWCCLFLSALLPQELNTEGKIKEQRRKVTAVRKASGVVAEVAVFIRMTSGLLLWESTRMSSMRLLTGPAKSTCDLNHLSPVLSQLVGACSIKVACARPWQSLSTNAQFRCQARATKK